MSEFINNKIYVIINKEDINEQPTRVGFEVGVCGGYDGNL